MPAAPWVVFKPVNQLGNLVNAAAIAIRPFAPLAAIHRAKVSVFICPFIPNGYAVILKVFDIGAALQEPEKLVDNGAQVQLFSGKAGEALAQVKTGLSAENADGTGAGAVISAHTVCQNIVQQLKVLFHIAALVTGKEPREFAEHISQHAEQG